MTVLFIGNSFTARNDLPGMIAKLAAAGGEELDHRLINVGGASLRTHWNKGDAQVEILAGDYDYVVLQEQSTLPVKNSKRMHENIRLFDEVIKKSGAKTALFMTWARRHEPKNQALITSAYTTIGKETIATVVPVGTAWQRFLKCEDQPDLYDRDGSHPSAAGTLLAAAVFYTVLFGRIPVGLTVDIPAVPASAVKQLINYIAAEPLP